jgi:hypothetical protein
MLVAFAFPFGASRITLALASLIGLGAVLGHALFKEEATAWRMLFGFLSVIAGIMIVGSVVYYLYRLDLAGVLFVILAVALAVLVVARLSLRGTPFRVPIENQKPVSTLAHPFRLTAGVIIALVSAAIVVYAFIVLHGAATATSIRSPWDVAPQMFFVLFLVAALGTLIASAGGLAPRWSLLPAIGLAVLAVTVATLIYSVGFGFDPFIHRATEAAIFRDGFILPKPLYYLGQYALVTVLARLFGGGVAVIDACLIPIAFALTVPVAYWSLRKALSLTASGAAAGAVAIIILPLASFVAATPQGLADALFLMTGFLALPAVTHNAFPRRILFLLALATAAVHPLAGIPLLVFVALVAIVNGVERKPGLRAVGRWIVLAQIALVGSVALPAVFVINSMMSGAGVALDTSALQSPGAIIEDLQSAPVVTRQFSAIYDFAYSWQAWGGLVIALLALVGLIVIWRRTKTGFVYVVSATIFMVNYVLLKSVVQFPFLISYERSNYADRLLELTTFILAPLAMAAVAAIVVRAGKSSASVRVGTIVLLAAVMTGSVYLAYPRRDKYESSHDWSTSAADVETVVRVNADADGKKYVVLADQSVSAAAVQQFGFPTYYPSKDPTQPGPVFYYPIPTGGELYQDFLDANTALGSRASIVKAMDLTGVDTAYYVVSYYWWHAQEITLNATRAADASWNVADGDYVFKYMRRADEK